MGNQVFAKSWIFAPDPVCAGCSRAFYPEGVEKISGHDAELAAALATLADVWVSRGQREDAERA